MIESRRAASPTGPAITWPSSPGPRWTGARLIAASASGSGPPAPPAARPQMPHMSGGACPARDRGGGLGHHAEVETRGTVRDVLEVVGQLLLPRHLARHPQLREAGHAGRHHEPLPVLRDLLAELLEERRPDRARPNDAHVARKHVHELGKLVQVRGPQPAADARGLALGQAAQLGPENGSETALGVNLEGA